MMLNLSLTEQPCDSCGNTASMRINGADYCGRCARLAVDAVCLPATPFRTDDEIDRAVMDAMKTTHRLTAVREIVKCSLNRLADSIARLARAGLVVPHRRGYALAPVFVAYAP